MLYMEAAGDAPSLDDRLSKLDRLVGKSLEALREERHCCTWRAVSTASSDTRTAATADITAAVTTVVMETVLPAAIAESPAAADCGAATASGRESNACKQNLEINLRRSRDCIWVDVSVCVCVDSLDVSVIVSYALHLLLSGTRPLLCPHKRIVTITKVYIARNNIQVELIRLRKN